MLLIQSNDRDFNFISELQQRGLITSAPFLERIKKGGDLIFPVMNNSTFYFNFSAKNPRIRTSRLQLIIMQLLTECEVFTGNLTLKSCRIDLAVARSLR